MSGESLTIQQAASPAVLDRCMYIDRVRLGRRVRELARLREPTPDQIRQTEHVLSLIGRSIERRDYRVALLPRPRFPSPDEMPVVAAKARIASAISENQVVVVCGATGSGKTTQLPKICLELGRGVSGMIGHTQPRRIAARSVAQRVAQELGTNLGNIVGYKVRFTDQVSRGTLLKVMTDGILLAETQNDRMLAQYDTLIIDEAHERSLNIDFLLGYIRQLLPQRPDFKLIVTSATIDPRSFAEHFVDAKTGRPAPIIEVSGRTFPVEVRYRPLERPRTGSRGGDEDVLEIEMEVGVVQAAQELIGAERAGIRAARQDELGVKGDPGVDGTGIAGLIPEPASPSNAGTSESKLGGAPAGSELPSQAELPPSPPPRRDSGLTSRRAGSRDRDILVFLPGEREIRETTDELRAAHALRDCEIVPLYARLSTDEQNRVFAPHTQRRIILATNVAETSLTLPGIGYVIDSGLARVSRYSPRTKVQRLPIEPISRASAQQRSGRCGRTSPGIAVRLYGEDDLQSRPEFTDPEILRTNLASVILQMKALGLVRPGTDVSSFPFMTPPNSGAVRDGYDTLVELGAIDEAGELTPIGRKLARLPVDPRIGRMILAADEERCLAEVLIIAAALSVQDPRERPAAPLEKQQQADALHEKWRDEQSDFLSYIKLWHGFFEQERRLSGAQLRKWCRANMLSYVRLREWQDVRRQLEELTGEIGLRPSSRQAGYDQIHRSLLTGLLSNVGTKAADKGGFEYDGVRSLKFSIFPGSALFKERPKWVMAAELVRTTRLYARTVAAIQPAWIEKLASHLVTRTHEDPHWTPETAQVGAFQNITLWGLPIMKRRRVHYGPIEPQQSRAIFIEHALVRGEYMTSAKFFETNFKTQRSIEHLEEKKRQADLLADPSTRFGFYAERIPEGIYDGPGFERWRKKAEARQPDALVIPRPQMLALGAVEPPPEQFPDSLTVAIASGGSGTLRVSLEYRHKHNDPEDGVTAIVPLSMLASLDPKRFDWLVPGLATEKVVELIRALPKSTRVNLAPATGFAERTINALATRYGEGDFLSAVAEKLTEYSPLGVTVLREALAAAEATAAWPSHLHFNFRIIETSPGKPVRVVATGRDLAKIKRDMAHHADTAMASLPAGPYNRGGVTVWDAGELPVVGDLVHAGGLARLHIGLADETPFGVAEPRVGVRPFSGAQRAAASHRAGVVRLLAMDVAAEARSLIQTTPGIERVLMRGAPLIRPDLARRDLAELAALEAFAQLPPTILDDVRNRAAFDRALDAGWDRLGACGRMAVALAESTFTVHHELALAIESAPAHWTAPLADVRNQLASLFLGRWLVDTPFRWLQHFPRYLEAARLRLVRLPGRFDDETRRGVEEAMSRDAQRMNEYLPLWSQCVVRLQHTGGLLGRWDGSVVCEYRWLVEELRVSLFAQELRTATPVSVKKLTERWSAIVVAERTGP